MSTLWQKAGITVWQICFERFFQRDETDIIKKHIHKLKAHFISIIIFLLLLPIYSEAIKIATWNLLNYPGTTGALRDDDFRKVIEKLGLDILVVQEMAVGVLLVVYSAGATKRQYEVLF